NALLQRQPLHAVRHPWNRDARLRDRPTMPATIRARPGRDHDHPLGRRQRHRHGARIGPRRRPSTDRRCQRRSHGPAHGVGPRLQSQIVYHGSYRFGFPFTVNPDRVDVPRNAARGLRYLDRYVTITQGEVFFATQLLAELEGLERGPAGNTSLAAALSVARELPSDALVVVQETEYTGAGKHPTAQLTMARNMGIDVRLGDPKDNRPGKVIVIPEEIDQVQAIDIDLNGLRRSYLGRIADARPDRPLTTE